MSARALARAVGVSPSLVSQIETGKANPSVRTLYAIVSALGVSLDELFANAGHGLAGKAANGGDTHVVRFAERSTIALAGGVRWGRLTPAAEPNVNFVYVTYEVGGASCPPDVLMRHSGDEYGLVLSGMLGAHVGGCSYELRPGDSIALSSFTPHRFWTIGDEPCTGVWILIGSSVDLRLDARA